MLRKIVVPHAYQYLLQIPPEYLHRPVEILLMPFDVESEPLTPETDEETRRFMATFGSWQDTRTPEEIVADIYASRTTTEREFAL